MELTDSQISYFVDNRLRLPKGKRTEYLGQVDRSLSAKIAETLSLAPWRQLV